MSAAGEVGDAEWERVIRVNLTAPSSSPCGAPAHAGGGQGRHREHRLRGQPARQRRGRAYTASKHGIAGLAESLAVTYRNKGIRANAIAPGGAKTAVDRDALGPQVLASYLGNVGTAAEAEEQAAAILFLASDAASNINGAILPVDNGWSAV